MTPRIEHEDVRHLDDEAWLARLQRSIAEPVQDGRAYPGFPEDWIQRAFVGSAGEHALQEAWNFYRFVLAAEVRAAEEPSRVKRVAKRARAAIGPGPGSRYLDFGCGWGRIGRFFLREFRRGDMAGVDVDPGMIEICERLGVPGAHLSVENDRPLPFADGQFRLVTAYSVFTHLPERLFRFWLDELLRVTSRGGLIVFTVEPPRFLDFIEAIDAQAPESGWHAALALNQPQLAERRAELERDGIVFLPTGGGPYRPVENYGDTVVRPDFLASVVGPRGRLLEHLDDPSAFWQAVAVVQKT